MLNKKFDSFEVVVKNKRKWVRKISLNDEQVKTLGYLAEGLIEDYLPIFNQSHKENSTST